MLLVNSFRRSQCWVWLIVVPMPGGVPLGLCSHSILGARFIAGFPMSQTNVNMAPSVAPGIFSNNNVNPFMSKVRPLLGLASDYEQSFAAYLNWEGFCTNFLILLPCRPV